jgi:hypothetical protein
MSRNRQPAREIRQLAERVDQLAAATPPRPLEEASIEHRAEQPEPMAVRHLGLEHVGRWIQINAVPITLNDKAHPTVNVQVGRLVGIRKGEYSRSAGSSIDPTRRLVLLQGSALVEVPLGVDHPVEVAPRAWS